MNLTECTVNEYFLVVKHYLYRDDDDERLSLRITNHIINLSISSNAVTQAISIKHSFDGDNALTLITKLSSVRSSCSNI